MKNIQNKWIRGAIPALLLHCRIGTVYCWSIFSQEIADYIGFSKGAVEWAFSFAIFFLGMSAAFLGGLVEKNIHKSSLIASITFALGMAGTGFFIFNKVNNPNIMKNTKPYTGSQGPNKKPRFINPLRWYIMQHHIDSYTQPKNE